LIAIDATETVKSIAYAAVWNTMGLMKEVGATIVMEKVIRIVVIAAARVRSMGK
jgi:hypothetical protein